MSEPVRDGLNHEERAIYEWQMWIPGFGESAQNKLKQSSVLISRVGGVGGSVAYQLAAAGVGKLVLAHAGNVKPSDLNRQILMTHAALGSSRVECAARNLHDLNPRVELIAISANLNDQNAGELVSKCDLAVCCAPLFEERLAMNRECVKQKKPMIDCAMYELTGQITAYIPGTTGCLACRVPEVPDSWKRQFPVLGAVSATVGSLAAVEAIKILTGIGEPLANRLLTFDCRDMNFKVRKLARRHDCKVCG